MRKPRLICIWRAEEMPDDSATTSDVRQTDELDRNERSIGRISELVCIHNMDRELCVICSRNWAEPQTGQLPYRPKAA